MPRARDPNRDKAFQIWKEHRGEIKLKDIAAQLGLSDSQIRKWKSQDQWDAHSKGNVTKQKKKTNSNVTKQKRPEKEQSRFYDEPVIENENLTEKQRLFCIYYVKSFNATQSAIKAGYSPESAHVEGSRQLRNDKVANEIRRIKAEMRKGIFIDAMDVLDKWIKIAFADITDYLTFGSNEYVSRDEDGEIRYDENDQPIYYNLSHVTLNESDTVDGSLITEVKQGKDGISLKLADKMRALEMLTKYFDILPDTEKRRLQEEKLKMELSSMRGDTEGDAHQQANSYLEALNASVDDVFDEDEGEPDGNEA